MKAVITVGISASGKTTWAQQQEGFTVICRDDVRRMLLQRIFNRELLPGELWSKWNWKHETEVTEVVQEKIRVCATHHRNIIIADTNLVEKYRTLMIGKLKEYGYEVELKHFPISFEAACKRDAARADGVGHSVIMKQWLQYQAEFGVKRYVPDTTKPKCIICDLDGTLAHMHGRSPFDWHRVDEDSLDEDVDEILTTYYFSLNTDVILLSGRDSAAREKTLSWLKKHNVHYTHLYMREAGDSRGDDIVKLELFDKYIRNEYNVQLVIDDRPRVVRLWQAMGLKTIIMGNPWIEF